MFCPKCSEPKTNNETIYCTKCGFDLSGMQSVVKKGGLGSSKRLKGIEQGVKLLILGLLLIPVWMFIGAAFPPADRLVEGSPSTTLGEAIAWILMWVAYLAGAARISYAFMFEGVSNHPVGETTIPLLDQGVKPIVALPSGEEFQGVKPGRWKTTDELFEPVMRRPKTSGKLK